MVLQADDSITVEACQTVERAPPGEPKSRSRLLGLTTRAYVGGGRRAVSWRWGGTPEAIELSTRTGRVPFQGRPPPTLRTLAGSSRKPEIDYSPTGLLSAKVNLLASTADPFMKG